MSWRADLRTAAYNAVRAALADGVGLHNGFPATGANTDDAPFVIITIPADSVPEQGTMRGRVPLDVQLSFTAYSAEGEDGMEAMLDRVHDAMVSDPDLGKSSSYLAFQAEDPDLDGEVPIYIGTANYLARTHL